MEIRRIVKDECSVNSSLRIQLLKFFRKVRSERPKIRKVGINISGSPNILKSISSRNATSILLILGENDHIGIPMRKIFVRSMTLNKLVHGNLRQRY
jgi:hypothetical protein